MTADRLVALATRLRWLEQERVRVEAEMRKALEATSVALPAAATKAVVAPLRGQRSWTGGYRDAILKVMKNGKPQRIAVIADETRIPRTTVRRWLVTLMASKVVEQVDRGFYRVIR